MFVFLIFVILNNFLIKHKNSLINDFFFTDDSLTKGILVLSLKLLIDKHKKSKSSKIFPIKIVLYVLMKFSRCYALGLQSIQLFKSNKL